MDERVRKTCCEMLEQRGYTIIQSDDDIIIGDSQEEQIIVFNNKESIAIANIKEYVSFMNKSGINHAIVIYNNTITPQANKTIETLPDMEIEIFLERSLLYNITKHRLVPEHIKLSSAETQLFKKKYGIKLPVIQKSDAIARFYNFKPGDIIKIIRKDGIVAYRIVK
jgi:DNA-directed RNA polymerase I, II, and III subunit RPABC1